MTNTKKWARRVTEWRSSGLTSTAYCEGKPFTAGGLRHWAHRVGKEQQRKAGEPAVRIGRVVRAPAPASPVSAAGSPAGREAAAAGEQAAAPGERVASAPVSEALVVELGAARVMVRPGFNQATLAAVLEVLAARGGAR